MSFESALLESLRNINTAEFVAELVDFKRKLYEAYVAKGFTPEQAIQLITGIDRAFK